MSVLNEEFPSWNDADYMVNDLGYVYNDLEPVPPSNLDELMTKDDVTSLLSVFVSSEYSSNEFVPLKDIKKDLYVFPPFLDFSNQFETKSIEIKTPNSWTITNNLTWIDLNKTSGTGDDTVNVSAQINYYDERNGTIKVVDSVTNSEKTIYITQDEATPVPTDSVILSSPEESGSLSCSLFNSFTETYYIDENANFSNAINLYTNSTGTITAPPGWYSNGTIAREWNGNAFIGSIYNC